MILASHLGRPKGKPTPEFSLKPVGRSARRAARTRPVVFAADCIGEPRDEPSIARTRSADRRSCCSRTCASTPEEEKNDAAFATALAELADVYVNDAFGAAHRAHASVAAIVPHFGDRAGAGLLMEKELRYLGMALGDPERPFVARARRRQGLRQDRGDREPARPRRSAADRRRHGLHVLQGARPAGRQVAGRRRQAGRGARRSSTHAKARGVELQLPVDHVVADKIDAAAKTEVLKVGDAAIGDRMGLDIGPETRAALRATCSPTRRRWSGTARWACSRSAPFAAGTLAVAQAVAAVKGTTIIGGGDSVAAVNTAGVADKITHISTGGGASLEFLGGAELPGVAALPDKIMHQTRSTNSTRFCTCDCDC